MTEWKSPVVAKILAYQLLMIITMAAGFVIAGEGQKAWFSVLGGLAAFIPNLYFALRVNKLVGHDAKKVLNAFYAGEAGKLLLTAALFILIFQIPNIEILPLFAGYVTVLSVFWFALLIR